MLRDFKIGKGIFYILLILCCVLYSGCSKGNPNNIEQKKVLSVEIDSNKVDFIEATKAGDSETLKNEEINDIKNIVTSINSLTYVNLCEETIPNGELYSIKLVFKDDTNPLRLSIADRNKESLFLSINEKKFIIDKNSEIVSVLNDLYQKLFY
ncbi:hypothetical protein [Clostridium thermarum]|uniref:hypothetical protein n=1 Tax=Clostridium thermarum TaxID=1716543 RepID=UPI00111F27B5|nr:hypothetical protein [Clostridium thermarum]